MAQVETLKLATGEIGLWALTGDVVGEKKWSTTAVTGSGGGGLIHQGTGFISRTAITSTTTTHDLVFVRSTDGSETPVELVNADVAVRVGHKVTVVWGIRRGKNRGPYLALYNHHTDVLTEFPSTVLINSPLSLKLRIVLAIAVSFVPHLGSFGGILSWTLLASAAVGYFTKRRRRAQLTAQARQLLARLVGATAPKSAIESVS